MPELESLKQEIVRQGYTVIRDVLSRDECEHFKSLLESDARRYSPYYARTAAGAHGLQDKSQEKVVFNLHNKHPDYMRLLAHQRVLSVVGAMLREGSYQNSEAFHIINISARCPLPGSGGQQLHLDSNLPGGDFPLIMIALWMLDDFTPENGATRVVPGSHKRTGYPENGVKYEDEVALNEPAGSVLIYNASLWHGGGEKVADGTRWGVVLGYGRWFIKPSFDFTKCTPKSVYDGMTEEQKELFGFRSNPPKDEFTRMRRRSETFEEPDPYALPG